MNQHRRWSIWVITLVTLTVVESKTIASIYKDRIHRRCFTCTYGIDCDQMKSTVCPEDRPYCGTMASSPNFTSSLLCVAKKICSLTYTQQNKTYEFACACSGDHCNRPLSQEMRNELLNYTSSHSPTQNNSADEFFTSPKYANVTKTALYNVLTTKCENTTTCMPNTKPVTTVKTLVSEKKFSATEKKYQASEKKYLEMRHVSEVGPRADALKQEVTVPSEDDEDESEGSGSYDESRSQKRPVSAPAAPSSYLPANENSGAHLLMANVFSALPFVFYIVV